MKTSLKNLPDNTLFVYRKYPLSIAFKIKRKNKLTTHCVRFFSLLDDNGKEYSLAKYVALDNTMEVEPAVLRDITFSYI